MQWFIDAAKPYAGMEIKVVSETIGTHEYEAKVLAPAFEAITGIKVTHDLIGEGDVVEKLQTQMQSGENIYDAYINDSDLIGTHWRYQQARNLTDWMAGDGAAVTNPGLDLADFIGTSFTTAPDGKLYQLPDQQFANLYWFRYDWFNDQKTKDDFKAKYGYDLGVPVNWSAYEDIAEFFTGRDMSYAGGPATGVYGNMDYGKKDPSLGWRYTDAWMSMAGMGDMGEPNGLPVDEWGVRVNEKSQSGRLLRGARWCHQRRGGGLCRDQGYRVAAEVRAAGSPGHDLRRSRSGSCPGRDCPADVLVHRLHRGIGRRRHPGDERGRHAEVAHGSFAARRLLAGRHEDRLSGRWFLDADEVHPGRPRPGRLALRPVRDLEDRGREEVPCRPDLHPRIAPIQHASFTERAPKLGGLIEFYRSPARVQWSPTGTNVPDYPKLAQLWWQNIGDAMSGDKTPQEALDALCAEQEKVLERIEKSGVQGDIGPKMNEAQDAQVWLDAAGRSGRQAGERGADAGNHQL